MTDLQFAHYLAGLIEGDWYFYTPKQLRAANNRLLYPALQICFHLLDFPLALAIVRRLKHGSVRRVKGTQWSLLKM